MSSAVIDEKKIDSLMSSYQKTETLILSGSDEHLDMILTLQKSLKRATELSIDVNENLEAAFNDLTPERAQAVALKLISGISSARKIIAVIKRLPRELASGVKSCLKDLALETDQIEEFVQDLIKYKVNNPSELKQFIEEIK